MGLIFSACLRLEQSLIMGSTGISPYGCYLLKLSKLTPNKINFENSTSFACIKSNTVVILCITWIWNISRSQPITKIGYRNGKQQRKNRNEN